MRLSEAFLDELKSRLRPSEVIGRHVALKRQGREWAGLSPFIKEKTPSFYVNDDKGFYHCFSSGKHGDVISFLQETQRLSFMEAVEKLAAEAGLALPAEDPKAKEREQAQTGLREALDAATKFFEASLNRSMGSGARQYLERRSIPVDVQQQFRLGYAPEARTALKDELTQRGFALKTMIDAGLVVRTEDGAVIDRFRNRLMFPITDGRGRIVAFGGRALDPDARAKYLNSPETPLFHKGATLYNLPAARALQAKSDGPLYVVEGYMDVIAMSRAGLAAVAPLGTAMTEEQLALAWRVVDEPILCFDGDGAGQRAAGRAAERALPLLKPGKSLRVVLLTGGKDPDDLFRDGGADALKAALAAPQALVDVVFAAARDVGPLDTPERQAGFRAHLRQIAARISDTDVREAYQTAFEERRLALFPDPRTHYNKTKGQGRFASPARPSLARAQMPADRLLLAKVIKTLLVRPQLIAPLSEHLTALTIADTDLSALRDALITLVVDDFHAEGLDTETLMGHLRHMGKEGLVHASGLDALLALEAADPALPQHEAEKMMAATFDRITGLTPLDVPHGTSALLRAARGMATLSTARAHQGATRGVIKATDTE